MPEIENEEELPEMTLGEHLEELRRRLVYALAGLVVGIGAALVFCKPIIDVLKSSYVNAMRAEGLAPQLSVQTLVSGLSTYFGVVLIAGLVIASPWIFYHLWMFVSAGLYHRERRYVLLAVAFSTTLFIAGAMFFLLVMAGPVMRFFVRFNKWMGVNQIIMLKEYVLFVSHLMLLFGIVFQTPLAVLMLVKIGIVTIRDLNKYRRHVVIIIVVLAALLTPGPDVVSQVFLAVPMWLLFELGVLLAYLSGRGARKASP